METKQLNYRFLRNHYKNLKYNPELDKEQRYYTSLDSSTGNYQDTSRLAGRIINDLELLDQAGELCGTFNIRLKHNSHDLGDYYSVEVYMAEISVDDDSALYDEIEDYMQAGREQIERILAKYAV